MKRWAARLSCLALVTGLALTGCSQSRVGYQTPVANSSPIQSDGTVYAVSRGTIQKTVNASGKVVPTEEELLAFPTDGRLTHLYVNVNQSVKKGDVLADLDVSEFQNQLKIAEVQADIAQLKVDQAMGKESPGMESKPLVAARLNLTKAEADYAAAQDALKRLQAGPADADLTGAAAAVEAAKAQLLKDQTALTLLQTPPSAAQLTILRANLDKAQAAVQQAQAAYDRVKYRSDIAGLPESTALQTATINYTKAKAEFEQATAGPNPDSVASAQKQIDSDQANLQAAEARLDQLRRGATPEELDIAQQNVGAARASLNAARAEVDEANSVASGKSVSVQIAQKEESLARLQVQSLQKEIDDRQIRAPFDGIVTRIGAVVGDPIHSMVPIMRVANPAKVEVAAVLSPADVTEVANDQTATIQLNRFPSTPLSGRVDRLFDAAPIGNDVSQSASSSTVRIAIDAPPDSLHLGDLANVTIVVQRKENILVLPVGAIQDFGGSRFVRVVGPDGRVDEVDVHIGISDGKHTEITSGLQEGQKVIAE